MRKMFLRSWNKWSNLTSILSDTIPGIQVVKAFNKEEKEINRFNRTNRKVTKEFNNIHHYWTRFWPVLMLGLHSITLAVWLFGVPRLISGTEDVHYLSSGTFVSFLLYMTMFQAPIEVIGQLSRMLNKSLSSAHRIFEVLDTRPTIKEVEDSSLFKGPLEGSIKFSKVGFSYDKVRKVIDDISFEIQPREMIGLVGESGGGKSTITRLLTRFYDVSSGEILIDGIPLKKWELGQLRKQIGMVLQDPFLFHGSLRDTISYGVEDVALKEIIEA